MAKLIPLLALAVQAALALASPNSLAAGELVRRQGGCGPDGPPNCPAGCDRPCPPNLDPNQ